MTSDCYDVHGSIVFFCKFRYVYSLSLVDWNGTGVVSLVIGTGVVSLVMDSSVSGVNFRFQQSYPKYCNSPNQPFIPSLLHVDHVVTFF